MGASLTKVLQFSPLYLFRPKIFNFKGLGENNIMSKLTKKEVDELKKRLQKTEEQVAILQNEIESIKKVLFGSSVDSSVKNSSRQKRKYSTAYDSEIDGFESGYNFTAKRQLSTTSQTQLTVYTDGACENNGKQNAKAGIGVWFGHDHPWNVSEPVKGRATNNTAEIQACIRAVQIALKNGIKNLLIKTDSQFVINSMTSWILRWKKNNWKLSTGGDVKNKTDFVELDKLISQLDSVKWEYVPGHKGHEGNEEADKLARKGATRYSS